MNISHDGAEVDDDIFVLGTLSGGIYLETIYQIMERF